MRWVHLALIGMLVSGAAAACAKARAETVPVMPELVPPPPPPRVVARYPNELVPTITPSPVESALATPPEPEPEPVAPKPEPSRPQPAPAEPEPAGSGAASLTLKPAPGVAAQTTASIRSLLDTAGRNLQRVNYAALDADGRAQFDTARRFMQQADEALKAGNLAFAGKLADKAATMSTLLVR